MTKHNIVITGSTRGIGYGLADAFLTRGCTVTVSGRDQARVDETVAALAMAHGGSRPSKRVQGVVCDVTDLVALERLWDAAATVGPVDVWINNAGRGHGLVNMWTIDPEIVAQVISANVLGVTLGSRVAVRHMLEQGRGQLFNMEGFGSNGKVREGLSVYGASKAAVRSLTRALVEETKDAPVLVGALSPGMVLTDLLLDPLKDDPEALEKSKRIFNTLADKRETVTPWLADQVLANEQHGAQINWLTRGKIMRRFARSRFSKRDIFDEGEL